MIRAENLSKRYGHTLAVDRVSFEIDRGEIVGFLGPNGAGKTTTMRMLTCYLPPSGGRASVAGHDVFSQSLQARRQIGYLPEGVPLYNEMRVSEYLNFRGRIKGLSRADRKQRVAMLTDRCGLRDVQRKLVGSLSKGYRQRVGLADALVNNPPVLFLDEPTIGLDPNQIREVRQLIRELGEDHTVLLSTHILPEVEMLCKRVLIIHEGRLCFQGSLADIPKHGGLGRRVVLEIRTTTDPVERLLSEVHHVTAVEVEQRGAISRYEIRTPPHADVREQVFALVRQHGWELRELHMPAASLEDVFVRLTTGEE